MSILFLPKQLIMAHRLHQITEALRRFGVSDASRSLLVVSIGPPSDASVVEKAMKEIVEGDLVPLENLKDITDWSSIRKVCYIYALSIDHSI